MKIVAVAITLVLTVGGALAQAATLPKPSPLMGGNSQRVQLHHYVGKPSKQTQPEWGQNKASLKSMPVQIHAYVTGRTRF
jgi:hypothetical protein